MDTLTPYPAEAVCLWRDGRHNVCAAAMSPSGKFSPVVMMMAVGLAEPPPGSFRRSVPANKSRSPPIKFLFRLFRLLVIDIN